MFGCSGLTRILAAGLTLVLLQQHATASAPLPPIPTPVESFRVGTLHIDKFGSGRQSLVLIPGLACGPWVWAGTIGKFAPDYSIYVITLPGLDGREATEERPLFTAFTRDFWQLLATRNIVNPVVVGHSLGGTLAIALAAEHPERLSAIVAVDGLPVFPALANLSASQREQMASAMAKVSATRSPAEELAAQKAYMNSTGTNRPELVEPAAQLAARSDSKAIAAWMHELLTTDLRPSLGRITIPFLEIMPHQPPAAGQTGGYTRDQTLAFYRSLVAGAPKATVVPVAPSRHFVMLDQPDVFHATLAQFFTSIQR